MEPPLGTRKLAGRDRPVVQDIFLRPGLLHYLGGKSEGIGRGERDIRSPKTGAGGAGNVIKLSRLAPDVVGAVACGDVHIARAAVERRAPAGAGFSGRRVVGDGVALKNVVPEFDPYIAPQRVDIARLLALLCRDLHRLFLTDGDPGRPDGCAGLRSGTCGRRQCRRRGQHHMTAALLRRALDRSRVGSRKRLACHGGRGQKQMTKQPRCDNTLKLGTHAV